MKVWITKNALTSGIKEMEVSQIEERSDTVKGLNWNDYYHGEGEEWHRTLESAKMRAEIMRLKKNKALNKQIKKYEEMKF